MIDGTGQSDRFPQALAPGWFMVDELRFEQLLTMSAGFADALDFVDVDGRRQGRWGEAFAADETVLLAQILDVDAMRLQARFAESSEHAPVNYLARQVIRLIREIDRWLKAVNGRPRPVNAAVAQCIVQLIRESLADEAEWVLQKFEDSRLLGPLAARTAASLDECWMAGDFGLPERACHLERDHLRAAHGALTRAVLRVQSVARGELALSLQSGSHAPAAALLIAFLKVFELVQQRINRFGERRIDFYYRRVLRMTPRGCTAGRVHLLIQRDQSSAREVMIPAGTRFIAGKDPAGRPIEFAADAALEVSKARVADLYTLRLERDPLISPECALNYITRASIDHIAGRDTAPPGAACNPWPLFGGAVRGSSAPEAGDARIGLAIGSSLLWLKEGDRTIRLKLEFAIPDGASAATEPGFAAGHSRSTFGRWLLAQDDSIDPDSMSTIAAVAQSLVHPNARKRAADPTGEAAHAAAAAATAAAALPPRGLVLDHLFDGLFAVSLTTSLGWYEVPHVVVTLLPHERGVQGVRLEMHLPPAVPAVIGATAALHDAEWPAGQPLIRLLVNRQSRIFPLSLFDDVPLAAVDIEVDVKGLREVTLSNQMGRLDATKPFAPFGPLPDTASYLVIGGPEVTGKVIDGLTLNITWAGLPPGPGGFADYYRGYGTGWHNAAFSSSLSLLKDGLWMAPAPADRARPLFASSGADESLMATSTIPVDHTALSSYWRAGDPAVGFDRGARGGFVKLQLVRPAGAFGHQAYPQLLTETVSANARRRRRRPRPLPNPPYTPMVERFTLDYHARRRISFGRSGSAAGGAGDERVLHVHPLGLEQIHPSERDDTPMVLPNYGDDGNLYIGLAADAIEGPLTLLFELCDETAVAERVRAAATRRVCWAILNADRWQPIGDKQVLSDTTAGFLTSGVVVFDLPAGIRCDNHRMPAGLFWLRASTGADSDCFAGLHAVEAQALLAMSISSGATAAASIGAGAIESAALALDGVLAVVQPASSFGERAGEDETQFRTRVGERLRHKDRACRPWDYERLVLERFPSVYKVKCFDNRVSPDLQRQGGQVLVVVVPATVRNDPAQSTRALRLNVIELDRIQEFLACRASPFARIDVRNACYERVQLRCTVRLLPHAAQGPALKRMKRAVIEYLSPWHDVGYGARFDWVIRGEDLASHLRGLPEVHSVSCLSLLHIGESDMPAGGGTGAGGNYWYADTARAPGGIAQLRWHAPWSLALPMQDHLIDIADRDLTQTRPHKTGITRLAVGATFIVEPEPHRAVAQAGQIP